MSISVLLKAPKPVMRKKLSIIVLDSTGTPVKQLITSKKILFLGCILAITIMVGSTAMVWDYNSKKQQLSRRGQLERTLAEKQALIDEQKRHLDVFMAKLKDISDNFAELKRYEKDIRVIAKLEPENNNQKSVFGIGGDASQQFENSLDSSASAEDAKTVVAESAISSTPLRNVKVIFKRLLNEIGEYPNILSATPCIKPAEGRISRSFGRSLSPLTGKEEFHQGLDIVNNGGSSVFAAAEGRITFAGVKPTTGKTIIMDHGFGFVTEYAHLGTILKQVGDQVKRGEQIATMGVSGKANVPNLHYEVHLNGIPVNPSNFFLQ